VGEPLNVNSLLTLLEGPKKVVNTLTDRDADGLLDNWERDGIRIINMNRVNVAGGPLANLTPLSGPVVESYVDLPSFGVTVGTTDALVELDWGTFPNSSGPLRPADRSLKKLDFGYHKWGLGDLVTYPRTNKNPLLDPSAPWPQSHLRGTETHTQTLDDIGKAFLNNPVKPVKIQFDTGSFALAGTSAWGSNFGGANKIAGPNFCFKKQSNDARVNNAPVYAALKENFDASRRWAFVWGVNMDYPTPKEGCAGGVGISEPEGLARGAFIQNNGTPASIMHELGHVYGLYHGNRENGRDAFGPQRPSVMQRLYLEGIPLDVDGRYGKLDYSSGQTPILREMKFSQATEKPLATNDRGFFVAYRGVNKSGAPALIRVRTNAKLWFDLDPSNDDNPRSWDFGNVPGYTGAEPADYDITVKDSNEWETVVKFLASTGNLPLSTETAESDPPAPDGPSPDLNFEYDGVLVDPSVARTSTGIKVTGVADGVYGRSLLAIEVSGGQASTPTGCASEGPRFVCEVVPDANQEAFPFAIDVPVTGAAALSVTLTVVMEYEGQGRRDINPANNTQTLTLPAIWPPINPVPVGALFATGSGDTVTLSGSGQRISGRVRSMANIRVSGAGHSFSGAVEYVGSLTVNGAGTTFNPIPAKVPAGPLPSLATISDYRPGGVASTILGPSYRSIDVSQCSSGAWTPEAGDLVNDTVVYVPCSAKVSGAGIVKRTSIVAEGTITLSGARLSLTNGHPSTRALVAETVAISGANSSIHGGIQATNSISVTGSAGKVCGLIAHTITVSGAGTQIEACS
jgi:hypothetical protein